MPAWVFFVHNNEAIHRTNFQVFLQLYLSLWGKGELTIALDLRFLDPNFIIHFSSIAAFDIIFCGQVEDLYHVG